MKTIIKVDKLTKVYGKKHRPTHTALNQLSFSMTEGEFVGIMGPSGSGKTTLLNVISTLDQASEGDIWIDGVHLSTMNQNELADFRAQKLGFIFQDFNLLENMTVFENIALPLSLQNSNANQILLKVVQVAKTLDIEGILYQYPAELSGGQKQRAAVARALIHQPTVILGDEPTGALDSKNATRLLDTLASLNRTNGVSIMLVTHDANCASYCNRLLFIRDGEIYTELKRKGSRELFYKEIVTTLTDMNTIQEEK